MSLFSEQRIGIVYEHTEQFNPLFELLIQKGIFVSKIDPGEELYDPSVVDTSYTLVFNDLSSPSYLSHQTHWVPQTLEYMRRLEFSTGADRLINGSLAGEIMYTKSRQMTVLSAQNVPYPKSRLVNNTDQLLQACNELKFPVVIKNNISNSSGSARRYETIREVINAIINSDIELNGRKSLLIQEYVSSKSNDVIRAEIVNRQFVYATRIVHARDYSGAWPIEAHAEFSTPSVKIIRAIEKIAQASRIDAGRIEYTLDMLTNDICFLGIQPHTSAWTIPLDGFDFNPLDALGHYIEQRMITFKGLRLAI